MRTNGYCNNSNAPERFQLGFQDVPCFSEEDFVGGISQFNIGTGIYSAIAEDNRCFNTELPEFLSWYEFGAANMTGAFIRAPSECDGMITF